MPRQGVLGAVEIRQRIADGDAVFFLVGDAPRCAVDGDAGEQVFPVAGVIIGERLRDAGPVMLRMLPAVSYVYDVVSLPMVSLSSWFWAS